MRHVCREDGAIRRLRRGDPDYPGRLEHLDSPPEDLWIRGTLPLPRERAVALVGTRRATEYGRRMATDLAYGMATAGWAVVSGLARGIDAAAHRGALDARGATVAVLGCGVDRVFPARNRDLFAAIARDGILVSEFPPGTPPLRHHFPRRNRIIAALCDGVIVVQAGLPSGALITADLGIELNRVVFAVPGPADQSVSRGVHRLLRDGIPIATCAADVLAVLEGLPGGAADPQPSLFSSDRGRAARGPEGEAAAPGRATGSKGPDELVRGHLLQGPATLYELAEQAGLELPDAVATLGRLELRGIVRALPGLRYELVKRP